MLEKGKINIRQCTVLVILFIAASSIDVPGFLATDADQDAWLAVIVAIGGGLLLLWFYSALGRLFPHLTLVEYSEKILGRWIGKIINVLFLLHFFLIAAILLRQTGDFMVNQVLPETPMEAILILLILVVIMGSHVGVEPLARMGELVFPGLLLLLLFYFFGNIGEIEIENLQPMLEDGGSSLPRAALQMIIHTFAELFVLLMIIPSINRIKGIRPAFFVGSLIGGSVLLGVTLYAITILGPDTTANTFYPSFSLAKMISIADIFEGVEIFVATVWIICIFFKLTLFFYASAIGLAQTLELKAYRPLLLPLGMVGVVLSLVISPNTIDFNAFLNGPWVPYSLTIEMMIPLALFLVAIIRKKFGYKL